MSVMQMLRAERENFADLIESLPDEKWESATLCGEWTVRDIVGHLVHVGKHFDLRSAIGELTSARFNLDRAFAKGAERFAQKPVHDLKAEFRSLIGWTKMPPFTPTVQILTDQVVHGLDIRRALGLDDRKVPQDRLLASLGFVPREARFTSTKAKMKGIRFKATDVDWTHGDGLLAEAPGETLLLAITGRKVRDELAGPGGELYRSRFS